MDEADRALHDWPAADRDAALGAAAGALAAVTGVRLAYAFGSFVRGEPFADLDVAVLLEDAAAWRVPGRAAQAVWEAVGHPPFDVDGVPLNDAAPALKREVVTTGRLLFERERGDAADFWVAAVSEDLDFREWKRAHGW